MCTKYVGRSIEPVSFCILSRTLYVTNRTGGEISVYYIISRTVLFVLEGFIFHNFTLDIGCCTVLASFEVQDARCLCFEAVLNLK